MEYLKDNLPYSDKEETINGLWEVLFRKTFALHGGDCSVSEECQSKPTEVLEEMKDKLNKTKSKLDKFEIQEWRKHTTNLHLCGFIARTLKRELEAELCTQAWAKLCTVVKNFDILKKVFSSDQNNKSVFRSLHLCEVPGAFVACVNHLLKSEYPNVKWDWVATSLNPYYEGNSLSSMIDEDVFVRWTLDSWEFGEDFTGDVTNISNFRRLQRKYRFGAQGAQLVTADGGMDCSLKPSEQEETVFPLLFWEVLSALNTLKTDGAFIFKMFIPFEDYSVRLMYLVTTCFKEVHVIKPGPSKPGNSEVYVACINFMEKSEDCEKITSKLPRVHKSFDIEHYKEILGDIKLDKDFQGRMAASSSFFASKQIRTIDVNISLHRKTRDLDRDIARVKYAIARKFIETFSLEKIEVSQHIVMPGAFRKGTFVRREESVTNNTGNFIERQRLASQTWSEKVSQSRETQSLKNMLDEWCQGVDCETKRLGKAGGRFDEDTLSIKIGQRTSSIFSSKFCTSVVLDDLRQALKTVEKAIAEEGTQNYWTHLSMYESLCESKRQDSSPVYSREAMDLLWIQRKLNALSQKVQIVVFGPAPDDLEKAIQSNVCTAVSLECCDYVDVKLIRLNPFNATIFCDNVKFSYQAAPSSNGKKNTCAGGVDLVIWFWNKAELDEFSMKKEKLRTLLATCVRLRKGGNFMIKLQHSFSYFTAGIIFLLNQMFEELHIFAAPYSEPYEGMKYIVFSNYKGPSSAIVAHFAKIYQCLACIRSSRLDYDVLHVVDITAVTNSYFTDYLKVKNVEMATVVTNFIRHHESERMMVRTMAKKFDLNVK